MTSQELCRALSSPSSHDWGQTLSLGKVKLHPAPLLDSHTNPHFHLEDTERHWQGNLRSVWDPNRKTLKCKAVTDSKSQGLPFLDHRGFERLLRAEQTSLWREKKNKKKTPPQNTLIHKIPCMEFQRFTDHPLKPTHKVQLKKLPLPRPPWHHGCLHSGTRTSSPLIPGAISIGWPPLCPQQVCKEQQTFIIGAFLIMVSKYMTKNTLEPSHFFFTLIIPDTDYPDLTCPQSQPLC